MKKMFERIVASMLAITLLLGNATVLAHGNEFEIIEEIVSNDIEIIDEEITEEIDEAIFNIDFNDELEEIASISENQVSTYSNTITVSDGVYELTYSTTSTDMVITAVVLKHKTATATVKNGVATYIVDIDGLGDTGADTVKVNGVDSAVLYYTDGISNATSMEFESNLQTVDVEMLLTGTYNADIIFDWENAVDITPEEPVKEIDVADGTYEVPMILGNGLYNYIKTTAKVVVVNNIATYTIYNAGGTSYDAEWFTSKELYINGTKTTELRDANDYFPYGFLLMSSLYEFDAIVEIRSNLDDNFSDETKEGTIVFDWENAVDITPEEPVKEIDISDGVYELTYSTTSTDGVITAFVLSPKTATATVKNGVATYIIDNTGYQSTGAESAKVIGGNSAILYYTDGSSYATSMEFESNLQTVNLEIVTTGLWAGTYEADVIFDWENAIDITPEEPAKTIDVADGTY